MRDVDLLAIGDVSIDLYLAVELGNLDEIGGALCFKHGSKIPVKTIKTNISGNAINVALGAKSLGLNTAIYTEMGNDEYAGRIEKELQSAGIGTDLLLRNDNVQTGVHPVIMYGGERTIFSHHDTCEYKIQNWGKPKWIYYTSIAPGFEKFQAKLVEYLKIHQNVGIAFNPGTIHMKEGVEKLKDILSITHVLFVNKEEAIRLTQSNDDNLEVLHKELQGLGPKLTIITDGKNGVSGFDGTYLHKMEALPPEKPILDKTGAGDAFSSGALAAIFYGKPLKEILAWGTINSSNVLTEVGAIHGFRSKDEMEELAKKLL